jgi:hypothetical protein
MKHRHLNHAKWTLAAIDSCIGSGRAERCAELREAALSDRALLQNVLHICNSRLDRGRDDPEFYDRELYEEWKRWAEGLAGTL